MGDLLAGTMLFIHKENKRPKLSYRKGDRGPTHPMIRDRLRTQR